MGGILVLSPHPDDDAIGCGGAILNHAVQGDQVSVIYLTSGEGGGHGLPPTETARLRENEARAAAAVLGITSVEFWRLPDGRVRSSQSFVSRLASTLQEVQPLLIYAPHSQEQHPDHRATFRMLKRAMGELRPSSRDDPPVRLYEVWTPMKRMDVIVDISEHIESKIAAIRKHESQCKYVKFDDSIRGLNRYRGEMHSWPGGPYAEVFQMLI